MNTNISSGKINLTEMNKVLFLSSLGTEYLENMGEEDRDRVSDIVTQTIIGTIIGMEYNQLKSVLDVKQQDLFTLAALAFTVGLGDNAVQTTEAVLKDELWEEEIRDAYKKLAPYSAQVVAALFSHKIQSVHFQTVLVSSLFVIGKLMVPQTHGWRPLKFPLFPDDGRITGMYCMTPVEEISRSVHDADRAAEIYKLYSEQTFDWPVPRA